MKNRHYLFVLFVLVIAFIGLGNLKVALLPSDYDIKDKTYIEEFVNLTNGYGNKIIDGFNTLLNKFETISEKLNKIADNVSNVIDKGKNVIDWINENIIQEIWKVLVGERRELG